MNASENGASSNSGYLSEEQVIADLRFLLDSFIHPDRMVSLRSKIMRKRVADSARKLLDCKKFLKDYKPEKMADDQVAPCIRLWCHVELSDQPKEDPVPPPELILLPLNATVADLKKEVTTTFQEVYAMYKRFQAEELLGYGPIKDYLTVKFLLGTSGSVRILGKCPVKHGLSRFRMERGLETWKVDCTCGAKDDDGESMLACDSCSVWQHTRCAGIDSSIAVPSKFICLRCIKLYHMEARKKPGPEHKIHPMDEANEYKVSGAKVRPVDAVNTSDVGEVITMNSVGEAKSYDVCGVEMNPAEIDVEEAKNNPLNGAEIGVDEAKGSPLNGAKWYDVGEYDENYYEGEAKTNAVDEVRYYDVNEVNITWEETNAMEEAKTPCTAKISCRREVAAVGSPAVACNLAVRFSVG